MTTQDHPPLFSAKLVLGLTVIAVGLVLLVDSLHLFDAWRLLTWWPLALAALGVAHLLRDGILSRGGHLWLAFSVAGFIQQFGPWGLLDRWWPLFLVWAGVLVTLRAIFPQPRRARMSKGGTPSPSPAVSCDAESDSTQVKP